MLFAYDTLHYRTKAVIVKVEQVAQPQQAHNEARMTILQSQTCFLERQAVWCKQIIKRHSMSMTNSGEQSE